MEHISATSLLERLMKEVEIYLRHPDETPHYDPRVITKLVRNYRYVGSFVIIDFFKTSDNFIPDF